MQLNPYLNFNGQCEAAFKFYEQCLGGKIETMMTHAGSPMEQQTPPEWRDKIMHARLAVGGTVLMGSDGPPGGSQAPHGFAITLTFDNATEGKRIFDALAEGGKIQMPFQETFWATGFGMAVDRFGIPWMVNCEKAV